MEALQGQLDVREDNVTLLCFLVLLFLLCTSRRFACAQDYREARWPPHASRPLSPRYCGRQTCLKEKLTASNVMHRSCLLPCFFGLPSASRRNPPRPGWSVFDPLTTLSGSGISVLSTPTCRPISIIDSLPRSPGPGTKPFFPRGSKEAYTHYVARQAGLSWRRIAAFAGSAAAKTPA